MEELKWYGWKDIRISTEFVGETITKGSGKWAKEYTYIKIPVGYGYDKYCFLLSEKLVHISNKEGSNKWWFSICHDMNIELIYDPEERKAGERYKRYRITGYELFESIFKAYEVNFVKEYEERKKQEEDVRIKRDKSKMGSVICGIYVGNTYCDSNLKYSMEHIMKAYFYSGKAYSNNKFDKVHNVKRIFVIDESMSKYEFLRFEVIINAYLAEYQHYYDIKKNMENNIERDKNIRKSKSSMKAFPEVLVVTNLNDISTNLVLFCDEAMETIRKRLSERLNVLRGERDNNK